MIFSLPLRGPSRSDGIRKRQRETTQSNHLISRVNMASIFALFVWLYLLNKQGQSNEKKSYRKAAKDTE